MAHGSKREEQGRFSDVIWLGEGGTAASMFIGRGKESGSRKRGYFQREPSMSREEQKAQNEATEARVESMMEEMRADFAEERANRQRLEGKWEQFGTKLDAKLSDIDAATARLSKVGQEQQTEREALRGDFKRMEGRFEAVEEKSESAKSMVRFWLIVLGLIFTLITIAVNLFLSGSGTVQ